MATTQNVSLTAPTDYSSEALAIERKRKLAEALQAQGMQQQPTEVVSGWAVPQGVGGTLAKLAQSLTGIYGQQKANQEEKGLAAKYQSDLVNTVMQAERARLGSPAKTIQPDPQEAQQSADQGSPEVGPASVPAVPANTQLANALLLQHPATQSLGLQGMQRDMQMQQFMNLGGQAATPAAASQAAPGAPVPPGAPQSQPGFGGPAGGVPMAVWLQADPTGTKYIEQLAKDHAEGAKPIINRGYGVGTMVNGKYVPDQASLEQALAMERGKQSIAAPMEPPITLKLSGGQEAQLSRPEYAEYQRTGQLPERYGQTPKPGVAVPGVAAAPRVTGKPGLGTPGLSQSQEDQIRQAREQAGGKAVDEQFAKDYVTFSTGGSADAAKQLSQLKDVSRALQNPKTNLTGPILGSTPDVVKKFTNPEAIAMRERVEEVVQRSLRAILGAQFTEKEGERLIARAYNPNLSESENAIRVNRLMTQLEQAYQSKEDAAKYFEKNGTLSGWRGKLPTMSDFDPESRSATGKVSAPSKPNASGTVNWNSLP